VHTGTVLAQARTFSMWTECMACGLLPLCLFLLQSSLLRDMLSSFLDEELAVEAMNLLTFSQ
jgi:hypothetical protein